MGNRLVLDFSGHATGKRGGVPIKLDGSILMEFRHAKIYRAEVFLTREEALEAAGIVE